MCCRVVVAQLQEEEEEEKKDRSTVVEGVEKQFTKDKARERESKDYSE